MARDVTASGAVTIEAQAQDSASAKGISAAVAMSNSVNVGVGVGLNVVNGANEAYVDTGGSVVKGGGITIEAITPASTTDDFVAWGAAAAGGKGTAQVAGSVGINVINNFTTEASARSGSDLQSSGGINVKAIADLNIQTLGAAGAFSQGGNAIGATITVGVLNATTTAYIGGNADAAGAISIDAENHLLPIRRSPSRSSRFRRPVGNLGGGRRRGEHRRRRDRGLVHRQRSSASTPPPISAPAARSIRARSMRRAAARPSRSLRSTRRRSPPSPARSA